ncbi:hypothetical protein CBR_g31629 [Chara braunii]|uniref:Myb-like domain-containing protein n=1 Tax=Chara braunii TaxID=69332 RepID=A0A388LFV7_CHABU|nr:hypothetical protein CBR_g31629 [Chara braunii]|eukprot:GBG81072.1 hypothetical protein CBR_g31629 [Chara braunii]
MAHHEGTTEVESGPEVVQKAEDGHREAWVSKTSSNGLVVLPLAVIVAGRPCRFVGCPGPAASVHQGGTVDGRRPNDEWSATEVVGRKVWDDHRRQSREASTAGITRGVAKINVGADDILDDEDSAVAEDCEADDGADNDDEQMEIRPVGRKQGGSRVAKKLSETRTGRRGKKGMEDASAGEGSKSQDFGTVEHMIALMRAKRDQDSHLAGLAHTTRRMKTKTWKWDNMEKRLVHMGVTSRKAVDCGKKWDNLYQQFKIVHKFIGESGKPNFFTLTPWERKERGFDFRMDERVYSEMAAMTRSDHTIHPTNLTDTGATGGVQMPGPRGGRNESGGSEGGGDGQDHDQGSTRDSISGGGVGGGNKRNNVRQQTFDTIADVMKEHGSLIATTMLPRGASAKGRKDGGVGDGGETQRGRGHILKSKRQRIDDASSSQTDAFLADEVAMVDTQGTAGVARLGFGRDGLSREQLQALKHSVVGGAAGTVPRTPDTAGVVITGARVAGQLSAAAGQGQPRQPLPLQHVGASGGGHTASAQKGDATASASQTVAADHTAKGGVAEGVENRRVDDVGRDDGRRDGKREGNDGDDRPLVSRGKGAAKEDELEEKAKLWVDCDAF